MESQDGFIKLSNKSSFIVCVLVLPKFVLPLETKKKDNHRKLKRPHFKTNPIKYIGFSVEFGVLLYFSNPEKRDCYTFHFAFILFYFFSSCPNHIENWYTRTSMADCVTMTTDI